MAEAQAVTDTFFHPAHFSLTKPLPLFTMHELTATANNG